MQKKRILFGILLTLSIVMTGIWGSYTASAEAETETFTKKNVVVLDPGHGGADSGSYEVHKGHVYNESVINWKIACYTMEELKKYPSEDVYVIGGESVYRQLLPYCDKAYVTKIDHAYVADTHFPNLDEDPEWEMTKISEEQTYFDLEYVFTIYERK